MVQRIYKKKLKVALFFNGKRGQCIYQILSRKKELDISLIFLAKKNLNLKNRSKIFKDKRTTIIKSTKEKVIFQKLKSIKIDLIISAGFPYLFGKKYFQSGIDILNLHGGPLPKYKGGSPLIWQKINGEKLIKLSITKASEKLDEGKVLGSVSFPNKQRYNIKTIQNIANSLFPKLLVKVVYKYYLGHKKIKISQLKTKFSNYYKQRKESDSLLDLKIASYKNILNFFNALVPLYHPPFLYFGDKKINIKKIGHPQKIEKNKIKKQAGFIEKKNNRYYMYLKDSKLLIKETSFSLKKLNNNFLHSINFTRDYWIEKFIKKKNYIVTDISYLKYFKNFKNSIIFLKSKNKVKQEKTEKNLFYIGKNISFIKKINKLIKIQKIKNLRYSVSNNLYRKQLKEIAYKNFRFSRFHLDKRIQKNVPNIIKREWLENFFKGKRSDLLVGQYLKKTPTGFALIYYTDKKTAVIDLICIDRKFQGKGLADNLLKKISNILVAKNYKKIIVSTQKINLAAIKLYLKNNYKVNKQTYLYHFLNP